MTLSKYVMAAAFAGSMLTANAYAQEAKEPAQAHENVKMEKLPAAVKTTVQREAKGKKIDSISKETRAGETVYQVELSSEGKTESVEISQDGTLLAREFPREPKSMHEEKGMHEKGMREQQGTTEQKGTSQQTGTKSTPPPDEAYR